MERSTKSKTASRSSRWFPPPPPTWNEHHWASTGHGSELHWLFILMVATCRTALQDLLTTMVCWQIHWIRQCLLLRGLNGNQFMIKMKWIKNLHSERPTFLRLYCYLDDATACSFWLAPSSSCSRSLTAFSYVFLKIATQPSNFAKADFLWSQCTMQIYWGTFSKTLKDTQLAWMKIYFLLSYEFTPNSFL